MRFSNRTQAGALLADALAEYITPDTVVYAMPRGGAVVAAPIARRYKLPLEFAITRKIGHPHEPEFAIGVVSEDGTSVFNHASAKDISDVWIREESDRQRGEALRRRREYTGGIPIISAKNKVALIVDDGAATGLSLKLAIQMIHNQHPKKILVALPIAPRLVAEELKHEVDDAIVLWAPDVFAGSVGAYYDEFDAVPNRDVARVYVELHEPAQGNVKQPEVGRREWRRRMRRMKKILPLHE